MLAEAYLSAHGSQTRMGDLSSQLEMSARLFSSYVCTPNTTILGDLRDNRWSPGGCRIAPNTDELSSAGASLAGMAGACKEMGLLKVLNDKSRDFEPSRGMKAEMYDVGLINKRMAEKNRSEESQAAKKPKHEISFDEPEL